jgi:hypothetical protein
MRGRHEFQRSEIPVIPVSYQSSFSQKSRFPRKQKEYTPKAYHTQSYPVAENVGGSWGGFTQGACPESRIDQGQRLRKL